jgi:hypothetical protein
MSPRKDQFDACLGRGHCADVKNLGDGRENLPLGQLSSKRRASCQTVVNELSHSRSAVYDAYDPAGRFTDGIVEKNLHAGVKTGQIQ